jgi:hypothetical protein
MEHLLSPQLLLPSLRWVLRRVRGGTNYLSQQGRRGGAYPVLFAPCSNLAVRASDGCFIDPFDRPGDAVLSQRRGLLIVK